ncbi:MAG: GNAT family N-acetyltransferase [Gammaproteobacteria bacterium]|nr:GNAT family N-acetyltransferase [Gammaproteobacteria bacterium]
MAEQPLGPFVADTTVRNLPNRQAIKGKFIELHGVDPEAHLEDLYQACSGDRARESVWTYMPRSGPFTNPKAMQKWLYWCKDHPEYVFYSVFDKEQQKYIGMTSFVSIVPDMQRLEVGFIWYTPASQRGKTNTESIYLMLCEAFDRLKNRRVEWKCDALNQPSRNAALRLGFQFEGIFRQHMIVNDRNRDTAWFAMMDFEWPQIKKNMQDWLYDSSEYFSLAERNAKVVESVY